jgi:hypothetical protein
MNCLVVAAVERARDPRQREATPRGRTDAERRPVGDRARRADTPRFNRIGVEDEASNTLFYWVILHRRRSDTCGHRLWAEVVSYLEHGIAKQSTPLAAMVEGTLSEVSGLDLPRPSRAALSRAVSKDIEFTAPLRDLLLQQSVAVGCTHPEQEADAVFHTVMGSLRCQVAAATQPSPGEVEYRRSFCLKVIDQQVPASRLTRH